MTNYKAWRDMDKEEKQAARWNADGQPRMWWPGSRGTCVVEAKYVNGKIRKRFRKRCAALARLSGRSYSEVREIMRVGLKEA